MTQIHFKSVGGFFTEKQTCVPVTDIMDWISELATKYKNMADEYDANGQPVLAEKARYHANHLLAMNADFANTLVRAYV